MASPMHGRNKLVSTAQWTAAPLSGPTLQGNKYGHMDCVQLLCANRHDRAMLYLQQKCALHPSYASILQCTVTRKSIDPSCTNRDTQSWMRDDRVELDLTIN